MGLMLGCSVGWVALMGVGVCAASVRTGDAVVSAVCVAAIAVVGAAVDASVDAAVGAAVGAAMAAAVVAVVGVGAVPVLTSAAYTMFGVKQSPFKGHIAWLRQLHVRKGTFGGFIIILLWLLTIDAMFWQQL